jgi:hypothetical protein
MEIAMVALIVEELFFKMEDVSIAVIYQLIS